MALEPYFIDTSGFIGHFLSKDHFSKAAFVFFSTHGTSPLMTSQAVLFELLTLLRCREKQPVSYIMSCYRSIAAGPIRIHEESSKDREAALRLFETFDDHYFSFVDCLSFVLMKKYGIKEVLTSDKNFKTMGFKLYTP